MHRCACSSLSRLSWSSQLRAKGSTTWVLLQAQQAGGLSGEAVWTQGKGPEKCLVPEVPLENYPKERNHA